MAGIIKLLSIYDFYSLNIITLTFLGVSKILLCFVEEANLFQVYSLFTLQNLGYISQFGLGSECNSGLDWLATFKSSRLDGWGTSYLGCVPFGPHILPFVNLSPHGNCSNSCLCFFSYFSTKPCPIVSTPLVSCPCEGKSKGESKRPQIFVGGNETCKPVRIYKPKLDRNLIGSENKNRTIIYQWINLINGKRYVGSAWYGSRRLLSY